MKQFLLIILTFSLTNVFCQTIVDTIPQNKNVILEEFTGIHCQYCPDGHKISEQIAAAHPNDFFAINIHVGSYATPSAGEPDFRTSFGTAISGQSGLTGYPAGTINRHLFSGMSQGSGTAMSRGNWTSTTNTTLGQASYVNIAAKADLNLATRELTVVVEGFFTGTGAPSSMKLNVALLQNNIEGPQVGSAYNPTQVLPNGNYNHMHMLRHLLTGQWGESIDTTSQGTFFSRTYVYQIPTSIVSVPVDLANIEIVTFIAEGNQEIITGNRAVINYITPPGVSLVDLEIVDKTITPSLCGTTFTPVVAIKNNSTSVIADSFSVSYIFNNGQPVVMNNTSSLNPGDSVLISFNAITNLSKENTLSFSVDVNNVYHLIDMTSMNNTASHDKFVIMPTATFGQIHAETFENCVLGTRIFDHTIVINPTDERVYAVDNSVSTTVTWNLGAYEASDFSLRFDYYAITSGKKVEIIFEKMDFTGTQHGIMFDYAYATSGSKADRFEVLVSDDCGQTWTSVFDKSGSALATHAPVTARFYPYAADWVTERIDLSAFDGKSEVIIKLIGTSNQGNDMYLDNISIFNQTNASISELSNEVEIDCYPNPVSDLLNVTLDIETSQNVSVIIYDVMGKKMREIIIGNVAPNDNSLALDISDLPSGYYFFNFMIGNTPYTKPVIVE